MTRQRMMNQVGESLRDKHIPLNSDTRDAAETAADSALRYLLDYTQELSSQLMKGHLHSEAMTAGTLAVKIKSLLEK